jgi:hypothetical protein
LRWGVVDEPETWPENGLIKGLPGLRERGGLSGPRNMPRPMTVSRLEERAQQKVHFLGAFSPSADEGKTEAVRVWNPGARPDQGQKLTFVLGYLSGGGLVCARRARRYHKRPFLGRPGFGGLRCSTL